MQPHWLDELHVHSAPVPHASVEPIGHVFVQKCVSGSPRLEQSGALCVEPQSEIDAQYLPTPSSLPMSPGLPHFDGGVSGIASGVFPSSPPPQPITSNAMKKNRLDMPRLSARTIHQLRRARQPCSLSGNDNQPIAPVLVDPT